MEGPARLPGFYLVRFAVSTTACYLTIQLLITFAEVLLPFIFAVLCVVVLEPLKRFIARVLQRLAVRVFQKLRLRVCLEVLSTEAGLHLRPSSLDSAVGAAEPAAYGRLPVDPSTAEDLGATPALMQPIAAPAPSVRKAILAISILLCLLLTFRVLWLAAKVFARAGSVISGNLEFYRLGADRLKGWFEAHIRGLHIEALDYGQLLDDLVREVEIIGSIVTQNVLYTAMQIVVTFIFLIYMLWSPIKMDSNGMAKEVWVSTARYIKVKCLISAVSGVLVAIILAAIGLDLPAAFGFLAFLANFLPGIGSLIAALLPCTLAILDIRRTPTEVLLAFVCQLAMHLTIALVVEPVFFGISVEIHSVVVIIGIYFFYEVWGVPGMLISVPLLAVLRIVMRSLKQASHLGPPGTDSDAVVFLDSMLEGRWMSSVGEREEFSEEAELTEAADFADHKAAEADEALPFGPFHAQLDLWEALSSSAVGTEVRRLYQNHGLLVDGTGLLLILLLIVAL